MKVKMARTEIVDNLEGPGVRLAIWVQGCSIKCTNCCNPKLIPESGGCLTDVSEIINLIRNAEGIEGISILGGEPLDQPEAVYEFAKAAKEINLGVIMFSGYTLASIKKNPARIRVMDHVDLLIDGPFVDAKRNTDRRWVGSTNQNLNFFTNRYNENDIEFQDQNVIELELDEEGVLSVKGFPLETADFKVFEDADLEWLE